MEPKRKPKIMKHQLKSGDENRANMNNEMQFQAQGALSPISSQRNLRHSAGKLNLKKTKLQRRQNLHESDTLWAPPGPVRI